MKECLIDSDMLSFFLDGHPKVVSRMSGYLDVYDNLNVSDIVVYEILSGLYYKDAKGKLAKVKSLFSIAHILRLSDGSIEAAAQIYASLRKNGITIDDMDILTAGIAIHHGLAVATNNEKHFSRIPGLQIENWTK